jgi:hypothetical protein
MRMAGNIWGNVLKSGHFENDTDWRISLRWMLQRQIAKMRCGWNWPISCPVESLVFTVLEVSIPIPESYVDI